MGTRREGVLRSRSISLQPLDEALLLQILHVPYVQGSTSPQCVGVGWLLAEVTGITQLNLQPASADIFNGIKPKSTPIQHLCDTVHAVTSIQVCPQCMQFYPSLNTLPCLLPWVASWCVVTCGMFVWCAKQVVYFTACVSLFVSCLCRDGGGAPKWVHDSVHCVVHPLLCIIVKWQPHLLVVVPQCWHYPCDRSVTPCANTVHSHEEHAVFCVHGTFQCWLLTSESTTWECICQVKFNCSLANECQCHVALKCILWPM